MSSEQPTELPSGGAEPTVAQNQTEVQLPAPEQPQSAVPPSADNTSEGNPSGAAKDPEATAAAAAEPPMSKNALKRLKRQQQWEEGKDERRKRRKDKRHERKSRRREQRAALLAQGVDPALVYPQRPAPTTVPVALILDCGFESYMSDKEHISLCSQLTRCYADNRQARFRAHLWVAGWEGRLRQRFETVLDNQQKSWRGVEFFEGGFAEAAARARDATKDNGGTMIPPLQRSIDEAGPSLRDERDPATLPEPEPEPTEALRNIVYLTSDSPYTLERLEPNTSYVIGGIVDKNREKGLCYRRAREQGVRTAKLPIGQFMVMQSRQVLATNHVVEIMLRWLECEDWGKAFLQVIPKRKGGKLKGEAGEQVGGDGQGAQGAAEQEGGEEDEEDDEVDEQDEHEDALDALAEANAMDDDAERKAQAQADAAGKDQSNTAQEPAVVS